MAAKKRRNSSKLSQVRGKAKKIKKKSQATHVVYHSTKEIKVERALIENFIGLQKVMVGLSAKFDSLSFQISSLLQLFEISAKSLARKEANSSEGLDAKKVLEKLDHLSAQAGLIGRGLALIHEVREEKRPLIPTTQSRPVVQSMPFPSSSVRPSTALKTPEKNPVSLGEKSIMNDSKGSEKTGSKENASP